MCLQGFGAQLLSQNGLVQESSVFFAMKGKEKDGESESLCLWACPCANVREAYIPEDRRKEGTASRESNKEKFRNL